MATDRYIVWCQNYGLETIRRLAEEGLSDAEIAAAVGVTSSQLQRWRKKHPRFRDAIDIGRREADFSVIEAVYKRATGYNVSTKKTHKLKHVDYDPETGKKLREYEELAEGTDVDYIAPDLRAGIFWLKNRQPERWGEKGMPSESLDGGVVELPNADTIDPCTECDTESEE